jgi:hypothetical protein
MYQRLIDWIFFKICNVMGHTVAQLVEAPPTSQKVAGSNPDGKIRIFNLRKLTGRIVALRSTNEYLVYFLGGRVDKPTAFNLLKTSRNFTGVFLPLCTTIRPGVIVFEPGTFRLRK